MGAPPVGTPAAGDTKGAGGPGQPTHNWKPLRSASATATSFLQNNWNRYEENYHPSYVLDENPATAWVEGADGFGENEAITLPLTVRRARAIRLRIWNGYQKSMHLWTKNAMPQRVRITVLDGDAEEVVSTERELARQLGPQEVVVELPRGRGLAAVRLTILSVYEGEKYDDTCISDILVDVDSDVTHNAAAENAKHAALEQVGRGPARTTAAYFASKPGELPVRLHEVRRKEARRPIAAQFKRRFAARDAIDETLGAARFKAAVARNSRAARCPTDSREPNLRIDDFVQLRKRGSRRRCSRRPSAIVSHARPRTACSRCWTSARTSRATTPRRRPCAPSAFDIRDVTTERTTITRQARRSCSCTTRQGTPRDGVP